MECLLKIKLIVVGFCSIRGYCYSKWWVWDLRTIVQFQGSEMSPGLFQDFTGKHIKPWDSTHEWLNIISGYDHGFPIKAIPDWILRIAIFDSHFINLSTDLVEAQLWDPSWGLKHWQSEFSYCWHGILVCFWIWILWNLCGKLMTGRQKALYFWFLFFGSALIVVEWGLARWKILFRASWNCIFFEPWSGPRE